jgi:hypothetical protein
MNASINTARSLHFALVMSMAAVVVVGIGSSARAVTTPNLLVDPSFENPLLTPFGQILAPPYLTSVWGGEVAANVTGPDNGVLPASGLRMHRQDDDGAIASQSWQLINVSAYSAAINAGTATFNAAALYNVPADVQAGAASIAVSFFNGAQAPVAPLFLSTGAVLDNVVSTWQPIGVAGAIPPTTQFLRLQVAYANASMQSQLGADRPGFVDDARLTVTYPIPEPATIGLAGVSLLSMVCLARRR